MVLSFMNICQFSKLAGPCLNIPPPGICSLPQVVPQDNAKTILRKT